MSDITSPSPDSLDGGSDADLHNSVLLFGDHGPEVINLSQLYDPKNDKFVVANYDRPRVDVQYYLRTLAERTIRFVPVPWEEAKAAADAGQFRGNFYERNPDAPDVSGSYVPCPHSIIVVDIDNTTWGSYTLLVVDKVDDDAAVLAERKAQAEAAGIDISEVPDRVPTYESTLVPVNFSYGLDTATRAIDYNNDQLMVLTTEGTKIVPGSPSIPYVELTVDRKLMMYGLHDLKYVIKKNDRIITARTPESAYREETVNGEFCDMVSLGARTGKILTEREYDAVVGWMAEYTIAGETHRVTIPPRSSDNTLFILFQTGITVTVYAAAGSILNNIRVPVPGYLRKSSTLVPGEQVVVEIYEAENGTYNRLIIAAKCIVRAGSSTDIGSDKAIVGFNVRNLTNPSEDETWTLPQGVAYSQLNLQPYIMYSDGSEELVPLDNVQCFQYGESVIKSDNVGREFPVLFKYFPNGAVDWSQIVDHPMKGCLTCTKTVRIVESAVTRLRKVSIIPVWSRAQSKYLFKYLIYTNDFKTPKLIDLGGSDTIGTLTFDGIEPDGADFGTLQKLKAKITGASTTLQSIYLQLLDFSDTTVGEEKWLIGTELDPTRVYGAGAPNHRRPFLVYDQVTQNISVPLPNFVDDGVNAYFQSEFYLQAMDASMTIITPTHFRVRSVTNNDLMTNPMEIGSGPLHMNYAKPFLNPGFEVPTKVGGVNYNTTVVVEFLSKDPSSDTFRVLYGVPVEMKLLA